MTNHLSIRKSGLALAMCMGAAWSQTILTADFSTPYQDTLLYPEGKVKIRPVLRCENIYKPWTFWSTAPSDSFNPYHVADYAKGSKIFYPVFSPHIRELALTMHLGSDFSPNSRIGEIYAPGIRKGTLWKDIDTTHPVFKVLDLAVAQRKTLLIDLGQVPTALSRTVVSSEFQWNAGGLRNDKAKAYRAYVKQLFLFLKHRYGTAAIHSWKYQCLREPNNHQIERNPAGKVVSARGAFFPIPPTDAKYAKTRVEDFNFEEYLVEYKKVHLQTALGMADAGVKAALNFGNLTTHYNNFAPTNGKELGKWLPDLCRHLKTHKLAQPTTQSDTLVFSFSAYGWNPLDLRDSVARFRAKIKSEFPAKPIQIDIAEYDTHDPNQPWALNRGESTNLGAAMLAAHIKVAHDQRIERLRHWGFMSGVFSASMLEADGIASPSYRVLEQLEKSVGENRNTVRIANATNSYGSGLLDGMASSQGNSHSLFVFLYRGDRQEIVEPVTLRLQGLLPRAQYAVVEKRIDRNHANYFPKLDRYYADSGYQLVACRPDTSQSPRTRSPSGYIEAASPGQRYDAIISGILWKKKTGCRDTLPGGGPVQGDLYAAWNQGKATAPLMQKMQAESQLQVYQTLSLQTDSQGKVEWAPRPYTENTVAFYTLSLAAPEP
jgi:hypothetical protein